MQFFMFHLMPWACLPASYAPAWQRRFLRLRPHACGSRWWATRCPIQPADPRGGRL